MLKLLVFISLIVLSSCQTNKCPQFAPYCNCYASKLVVTCDNFTNFSQLKFGSQQTRIAELELAPVEPAVFDELNLYGLEIYEQVSLRNIKKFVLTSNPFESARKNNTIRLNLNNLTLRFDLVLNRDLNENCSTTAIDSSFKPLFASFNYILFGDSIDYSNYLCPLIFLNANIRNIEMVNLVGDARFSFKKLKKPGFIDNVLNNNISYLRIYGAYGLLIDDEFLDEDVFFNMTTMEIDNSNLNHIEDGTFFKLYNLKRLTLNLENMKEFLTSSVNKWMLSLNSNIAVNLNDENQILENMNESFVLILNNRIRDQNYLYLSEDLKYFKNFPHQKLVFPRILTKVDLNRTETLEFLLKRWRTAAKINKLNELNTTSTRLVLKALLEEPEPVEEVPKFNEAEIISIVYAISFALIFINWLVYKFTNNAHRKETPNDGKKSKNKVLPLISTISVRLQKRRQTTF